MSDVHSWEDFVSKLARAKKENKIAKMSVPTLIRLTYGGAFDSLTIEKRKKHPSNLSMYHEMFAETLAALKSKASLPKKGKNDIIGLDQVKNDLTLSLWRYQVNPSGSYPFLDTLKDKLSIMGYSYESARNRYSKVSGDKTKMTIASDEWKRIFSFHGTKFWEDIQYGRVTFALPGIITKASVLWNKERTKERMVVQIYTGKDNTEDLMIWPKYGENTVNPYYKEFIKPGSVWLLEVKASLRDGKQSGSILSAQQFAAR